MNLSVSTPGRLARASRIAAVAGPISLACASAGAASPPPAPSALEAWRASIAQTPTPSEGCFKAEYPSRWTQVRCTIAPARPYIPTTGHRSYTVGDGNDYAAVVSGLISSGVGSFPVVSGLKSEKGYGGQPDTYSIQLNSQFFKTSVCNGASNPASCLGWEQFVYSNSGVAFMQYWLINYGSPCPAGGWMAYSGDCYRNSSAVSVPTQAIKQLGSLKISGAAVSGGTDTLIMTTASSAYSTTGKDSVVNLAAAWNAAEFNVIGDGSGSAAKFNKGTSLTVEIALKDGLTAAPTCKAESGTTGETNNLTLGGCTTAGGSTPSVAFTEKR